MILSSACRRKALPAIWELMMLIWSARGDLHPRGLHHQRNWRECSVDRAMKALAEMRPLFDRFPSAIAGTLEIAGRCRFSLSGAALPVSRRGQVAGRDAAAGASETGELRLIGELDYTPYFLTVNAIVSFAWSKRILCQGCVSAVNSAVYYVLGMTSS